jgi:protein arginine kinase activator
MAERPMECSHCKKPVKVIYKEIVGNSINVTEMCADCPILKEKLHGSMYIKTEEGQIEEAKLICGHCGTSLESIIEENPVGCSECYSVFGDVIINELIESHQIPPSLQKTLASKKAQLIHIGRAPNKAASIAPPDKLTALNEALNEAIKRENYEQAALLRDQIKALMEKKDDKKE